ncbi:undecaprenyl/decaprenyl-phosphate alpha-N-acetylglucosaminyl 1-phosphate transferase [bacterium]|nr:undecaprenyl/decaprenyl-phosphate alpha-N-acetylglucosaminyl 1-phosphate transferase [bacterium]
MWALVYAYIFVFSLVVSLFCVPVARKVALKLGVLAKAHPEKAGSEPTPLLGGAAIYFSFAFTILIHWALLLALQNTGLLERLVPQQVLHYIPGVVKQSGRLLSIIFGGLLILVLGIIDDKRELRPLWKLIGQVVCSLAVVLAGVRITLFIPGFLPGCLLTVLWIVALTNAFNFLDNVDGLSAGVAAIASLLFFFTAVCLKQYFVSLILLALAGSTLGFLRYNFPPATIFMGDAGSMFLGYTLACLTVVATFYSGESQTFFPVVLPVVVLAIPLYELITVSFIRWRKNLPVFKASKDHFSFRLVNLGMSRRGAVLFIYLLTFCIGIGATQLPKVNLLGVTVVLVQSVTILVVVALLEHFGKQE